jgi:hypothetical protein
MISPFRPIKHRRMKLPQRLKKASPRQSSNSPVDPETAVDDFNIAAHVEIALVKKGHTVGIDVREGAVTLTINKHVLMLNRLEEELKDIAGREPGVIIG